MTSWLLSAIGYLCLSLQASASFGQVVIRFDTVSTYETVCHDESKTTSYDTGNVSCKVAYDHTGKSSDFAATGSCDPVIDSVTTIIPVCEQVAKRSKFPSSCLRHVLAL